MCEITARTKPRVDFIIILFFRSPECLILLLPFSTEPPPFCFFLPPMLTSTSCHSFLTAFLHLFPFSSLSPNLKIHIHLCTPPLFCLLPAPVLFISRSRRPDLPPSPSSSLCFPPLIPLFLQWGVSYCSPNRVINPARGNELRVTPASTTQLALRVHVCAAEIDKLCISLCVRVCMLGAFSYFDRLCVQNSVGCNDTFFLNTVIGCNSIITLNLLKLLRC